MRFFSYAGYSYMLAMAPYVVYPAAAGGQRPFYDGVYTAGAFGQGDFLPPWMAVWSSNWIGPAIGLFYFLLVAVWPYYFLSRLLRTFGRVHLAMQRPGDLWCVCINSIFQFNEKPFIEKKLISKMNMMISEGYTTAIEKRCQGSEVWLLSH